MAAIQFCFSLFHAYLLIEANDYTYNYTHNLITMDVVQVWNAVMDDGKEFWVMNLNHNMMWHRNFFFNFIETHTYNIHVRMDTHIEDDRMNVLFHLSLQLCF